MARVPVGRRVVARPSVSRGDRTLECGRAGACPPPTLSAVSERRGTSPRPTRTSIAAHDQSTRRTRAIAHECSGGFTQASLRCHTERRRRRCAHCSDASCHVDGDQGRRDRLRRSFRLPILSAQQDGDEGGEPTLRRRLVAKTNAGRLAAFGRDHPLASTNDDGRKPLDDDNPPGEYLRMDLDHDACYRAIELRDARFDGRFFDNPRHAEEPGGHAFRRRCRYRCRSTSLLRQPRARRGDPAAAIHTRGWRMDGALYRLTSAARARRLSSRRCRSHARAG